MDSVHDARSCSEHKVYLITRTELQIILDQNVKRVIDSYDELIVIKADRNDYVLLTELLVKESRCLGIDINAGQIDDRIAVLAGYRA